jgi:hypothetical protein
MIFGITHEERRKKWLPRRIIELRGVAAYAWLPAPLANGQWIWFEHYVTIRDDPLDTENYLPDDPKLARIRQFNENALKRISL